MILDKNRVYDGWDSLAAGMDAGRRPSLIEDNQCAVARDAVFRGGVPKTRPGIRQLALEFEKEIFYNNAGDEAHGPATLTDGIITFADTSKLISATANFSQLDVGSVLISDLMDVGTFITSVDSTSQVTMDHAQPGASPDVTFTIVNRDNSPSFVASHTGGAILSDTANFTVADVGRTITGGNLPIGTFITSFYSTTLVTMNNSPPAEVDVTLNIIGRTPLLGSTDAFYNEPFQCASFYAPAAGNECIMATFGGRLFQITPKISSAAVREIQLSQSNSTPVSFTGGHTGAVILADDPIFIAEDEGQPISGGNLPAGTIITFVNSGKIAVINASPATQAGITFTLHRRHTTSRRNRRTIKENFMVQADRWHITQDGESKPIIFDGVSARRAGGTDDRKPRSDEVVVGTIMAYGIGRLVVTRGRDIYFGDLFGSHPGDPSESVLKFTETNFLNEGFPAEIPYTMGDITAATFFPSQDSSTGQGELVVFTERGAVSFDLHLPRDKWKDSTFQQIALLNSTARGHRAVAMVNSDLWIRSDDGWRAYRQARSLATGWYQLPQSTEVTPFTDADTASLLRYGSAINFDNRLIVTCNPVPNQGRLYHDGILALDFSVLSSFGQATRPAWDGHWSKLKTLQLVTGTFVGKHRAFAFGLDADSKTQLYEISVNDREDFDGPITSEIEFRSHNFDSPFNEKQLYGADLWVDDTGPSPLSFELSFRPDSSNDYLPWKTVSNIFPPGRCGEITCGMCPTVGVGFQPRIKIPKPKDDCDDYSGRMIRRGYEFQPKLRWTGHGAIRRMRLHAMQEEEDPKAEC